MADNNVIWSDRKRTLFGLPLSFTKYTLTEDRLFIQTGLFTTTEDEVRLYRIMDVKLTITLVQKIFGVGTIKVSSADDSPTVIGVQTMLKLKCREVCYNKYTSLHFCTFCHFFVAKNALTLALTY